LSRCDHVEELQVESACYWCVKVQAGLISDHQANGRGRPTAAQLEFIGVVDPEGARRQVSDPWDGWDLSPIEAWERVIDDPTWNKRRGLS